VLRLVDAADKHRRIAVQEVPFAVDAVVLLPFGHTFVAVASAAGNSTAVGVHAGAVYTALRLRLAWDAGHAQGSDVHKKGHGVTSDADALRTCASYQAGASQLGELAVHISHMHADCERYADPPSCHPEQGVCPALNCLADVADNSFHLCPP